MSAKSYFWRACSRMLKLVDFAPFCTTRVAFNQRVFDSTVNVAKSCKSQLFSSFEILKTLIFLYQNLLFTCHTVAKSCRLLQNLKINYTPQIERSLKRIHVLEECLFHYYWISMSVIPLFWLKTAKISKSCHSKIYQNGSFFNCIY